MLIENVTRHVQEEEDEWYPKVREGLGRNQLQELGAGDARRWWILDANLAAARPAWPAAGPDGAAALPTTSARGGLRLHAGVSGISGRFSRLPT
ncbi:hypothetical protein GCM10022255_044630 [Dactylosporangium darangshiense]|uniref:Hemerythrin HHE cation binding domain-containing protein n=1 Tax=Dactylosporangium darangshiense TaxID=579108 RepID=A0ABP8DAV5_9ACTN